MKESIKDKIHNIFIIVASCLIVFGIPITSAIGIYFICNHYEENDNTNVKIIYEDKAYEFNADVKLNFNHDNTLDEVTIYIEDGE